MLRLRDIMSTEVITLDPNLTIREAMDVFASKQISGAPVVAGDEVVGVISASDLIQFSASLSAAPAENGQPADLIDRIVAEEDERPGEEEDPNGLFFTELWDDGGASVVERMAAPVTASWNVLDAYTVSDAMTRVPIHALPPDTLVNIAAGYMGRAKIHRVLVMSGHEVLGIVTTSDITRAVADGKLTARTFVFGHRMPQFVP